MDAVAVQGATHPDGGQVILQVDQGSPGNNAFAIPDLALLALLVPPATADATAASFVDDDGPLAAAALPSCVVLTAEDDASNPIIAALAAFLVRNAE